MVNPDQLLIKPGVEIYQSFIIPLLDMVQRAHTLEELSPTHILDDKLVF